MAINLVQIRKLSREKEDENWEFRAFLKHQSELGEDEIDRQVFATTRRVWAGIDCTTCANCCRELQPSFSKEEVNRLARRLGMEPEAFVAKYLEPTEVGSDNPWQTRTTPCPFLQGNLCSVYEDRPADCSEYPYLYKPEFLSRTISMFARIPQCPIVYEVVEKLKVSTGFRRKKRKRR